MKIMELNEKFLLFLQIPSLKTNELYSKNPDYCGKLLP